MGGGRSRREVDLSWDEATKATSQEMAWVALVLVVALVSWVGCLVVMMARCLTMAVAFYWACLLSSAFFVT